MYNYLQKNINNFLRYYYFDFHFKKNNLIQNLNNNLIKLEYFMYLKFYCIYLFLYYFRQKNLIFYSFLLNFQHILGEICMNNFKYYKISSEFNIDFLEKVSIYFFDFLLFNEIYFNKNISSVNKIIFISNIFLFQLGIIIHVLFTKRINYIKNDMNLNDNFNFLFLLPGFEDIYKTVEKTKFMNYSNFYFYLNALFFILY